MFFPDNFDQFYPDEEGKIEARKRLIFHARHYYNTAQVGLTDRMVADFWKLEVTQNKEYSHYINLLSDTPYVVDHIISWIFIGFAQHK